MSICSAIPTRQAHPALTSLSFHPPIHIIIDLLLRHLLRPLPLLPCPSPSLLCPTPSKHHTHPVFGVSIPVCHKLRFAQNPHPLIHRSDDLLAATHPYLSLQLNYSSPPTHLSPITSSRHHLPFTSRPASQYLQKKLMYLFTSAEPWASSLTHYSRKGEVKPRCSKATPENQFRSVDHLDSRSAMTDPGRVEGQIKFSSSSLHETFFLSPLYAFLHGTAVAIVLYPRHDSQDGNACRSERAARSLLTTMSR